MAVVLLVASDLFHMTHDKSHYRGPGRLQPKMGQVLATGRPKKYWQGEHAVLVLGSAARLLIERKYSGLQYIAVSSLLGQPILRQLI